MIIRKTGRTTKLTLAAVAIALITASASEAAQNENDKDGSTVEMMQIIEMKGITGSYSDYNYIDKVEVLGWSRNGLIAYRFIDDGGGYGGMVHNFVILNTVNDRIVERDAFNSLDVDEAGINEHRVKWNALLQKHNITGQVTNPSARIENNNALRFPFGNYQSMFNYNIINQDESLFDWELTIYDIDNPSVQKTITRQTNRDQTLARIKIIGYYKSPFENRIAVLVGAVSSFSGNVHFAPKLFGCNMNVGFN